MLTIADKRKIVICYKVLPINGAGWVRVSFAISGHFEDTFGKTCPTITCQGILGLIIHLIGSVHKFWGVSLPPPSSLSPLVTPPRVRVIHVKTNFATKHRMLGF